MRITIDTADYGTLARVRVDDRAINIDVPLDLLDDGPVGRRGVMELVDQISRAVNKLQRPEHPVLSTQDLALINQIVAVYQEQITEQIRETWKNILLHQHGYRVPNSECLPQTLEGLIAESRLLPGLLVRIALAMSEVTE